MVVGRLFEAELREDARHVRLDGLVAEVVDASGA
jgi:hypothetical protein